EPPGGYVQCVAFSPDGHFVAGGDTEGPARVWDALNFKELHSFDGKGYLLAFAPDSKSPVTGHWESSPREGHPSSRLTTWDPATGNEVRQFITPYADSVAFTPNGKALVLGDGPSVRFLNPEDGKELRKLNGAGPVAFAADGKTCLTGSWGHAVKRWE